MREQRIDDPLKDADDPATAAVNGIFVDLRDRRWLKWLFGPPGSADTVQEGVERIDDYMQVEIAKAWRDVVQRAIESWEPIGTAPRDGRRILIYCPDSERLGDQGVCEAWFGRAYEGDPIGFWQTLDYQLMPDTPTRWRLLPAPPLDVGR